MAFLTLTALEIVLGIDNIIFISILVGRLPKEQQAKARFFGLALAMGTRILLLLSIAWVMRLTADLFSVFEQGVSGRDLILFFGGLFLLFKSTMEIWHSVEGEAEVAEGGSAAKAGFMAIILQIAVIDIIFSLDSVITAVGLVDSVPVMVAAIVIAVLVMMLSAGTISDFIEKHPSLKILALSFLIVVGTLLISGLLVFPAATALQIARSFRAALWLAALVAAASVLFGIALAFLLDLPAGAAIILLNALFFATALLRPRHRSL